jgi:heptosyltransferase II
MIWHLPHIRAIAAAAGAPVTLLAKPRSLADQLLADDPAIADVQWVDLNPNGRRGEHDGIGGFLRLARKLGSPAFGTSILLHHSDLLAAATWKAGIPDRRGYGWGRQRWFLNNGPYLPDAVRSLHQHTRATRYLAAAGIAMDSAEPALTVAADTACVLLRRLGLVRGSFVAIGIGSSEALRQWGTTRFIELTRALLAAGWQNLVLLGGGEDMVSGRAIREALGERAQAVRLALGWDLVEVKTVLSAASFYVGNNTGVMNMAAATGIRTYGLFGTTPPFDHASQIVPIVAPDIGVHDGMQRLTLPTVLDRICDDRGRLGP